MSVYLEAVAQAREHRHEAEVEFRAALVRARQHHSLREIAPHAGITHAGVRWITLQEKENTDERP